MEANNIALLSLIVVFILILLLFLDIKSKIDSFLKKKDGDLIRDLSLLVGLLFLIYSILSPFISKFFFPFEKLENHKILPLDANELGDALGGTMGPFIAIAGVIFTFLAFYMQKIANDEIKEQFKKQQFEAQFYEMLRLHKENVNEIEIVAKDINALNQDNKSKIKGKLGFIKHNFDIEHNVGEVPLRVFKGREAFRIMKNEFEIYYSEAKTIKLNDIKEDDFHAAYELFFWGVKGYSRYDKRNLWDVIQPERFIYQLQNKIISILLDRQESESGLNFFNHITLKEVFLGNGYSAFLGHYYRHLYHTVKFVVEYPNLTYSQRRNYLKILRGQLSNYEQIMLFYNWMSNYGESWEDSKNHYFTKYKMIHNLWYSELNLDDFMKEKLFCLVKTYEKLKIKDKEVSNYEREKHLFESKDDIIKEFDIDISKCPQ